MKIDNGYPYNFNLEEIEEMVKFFTGKNQLEKALLELDQIEDSYFKNRNKIDRNKQGNEHLMGYSLRGLFLENPDPHKVTDFFHFKLREMISEVEKKINLKTSGNPEQKPKTLDEILEHPDFCYQLLMNSDPAVISKDFKFILDSKKKFKIVAWYEAISDSGWIKIKIDPKDLVKLLNEKISGVNFGKDGRVFRGNENSKAYDFEPFKMELKAKISKAKNT